MDNYKSASAQLKTAGNYKITPLKVQCWLQSILWLIKWKSICTSNHTFVRALWDKLPECIFEKSGRAVIRFSKVTRVNCTKLITVKFKSWRVRKQFYGARQKKFKDGKRRPSYKTFSVSVDLTKRCYLLLNEAKGLITKINDIKFGFPDINWSLEYRYENGGFSYFNCENELHNLINKSLAPH